LATASGKGIFQAIAHEQYTNAGKEMVKQLTAMQRDILSSFKYNYCATGKLGSRMLIGLGLAHVRETAILLHHTYACPYISGSALKGCLRSFVIRDLFNNDESVAEKDADFCEIFGTQGNSGKVLFLDAFPQKCDKLDTDIMNPHYPQYYQGTRKPKDDDSPIPIPFYAVSKGTEFTFGLVSQKSDIKSLSIRGITFIELLASTLQEMGIGAKTAIGYGWFETLEEKT
jgi:CRISPR-associated protein Cmr6